MYKKGELLSVEHPEEFYDIKHLFFLEDAKQIKENDPLKYKGEVKPVCEAYVEARQRWLDRNQLTATAVLDFDANWQMTECQNCSCCCAAQKYLIKYVGPFGRVVPQPLGHEGRTLNSGEAAAFMGRQRAEDTNQRIDKETEMMLEIDRCLIKNQSEVRILSPFIMKTMEGGTADCHGSKVDYVIMEYVKGMELGSYISQLENKDAHEDTLICRLNVIRQLLMAVRAYAKQYNAADNVHRDLKPANIMIDPNPEYGGIALKLIDFDMMVSLARMDVSVPIKGGTDGYRHPDAPAGEVRMADQITFKHKWDLYAVGLIMYEIMEGKPYFKDDRYLRAENRDMAFTIMDMPRTTQYPELAALIRGLVANGGPDAVQTIDQAIIVYERFLTKTFGKNKDSLFKMGHYLECPVGSQNEGYTAITCKVESKDVEAKDDLLPINQTFFVYPGTITRLTYGNNILGIGCMNGHEQETVIGAFANVGSKDRFIRFHSDCKVEGNFSTREKQIDLPQQITYKDVTIKIESCECRREMN